jgi:hypothetical protein
MEPKERTFVDALCDALDLLHAGKEDLSAICRALHMVGNDKLADHLAEIGVGMNDAINKVKEGRGLALKGGYFNVAA